MSNELIQMDLLDFDLYVQTLNELKRLPLERNNPSSVRDMLEQKLAAEKENAKDGRVAAIVLAFYNFTKNNSDYDFLKTYYENMLSYYFSVDKVGRYFDFIIKNEEMLDLVLGLKNDKIILLLQDTIRSKKLFAGDTYRQLLEKAEDKLNKSKDLSEETKAALEHFSPNKYSGNDLREERKRLQAEERSLRFKENARQQSMISPAASELGVKTNDIISKLNKKGIDLKTVDSLTLDENIKTFNASKVGCIKNDKFKNFVDNIRKANYLRNLNFSVDDSNVLTVKSKVTTYDKMARAERKIVMGISSSAQKVNFGMKATVILTGTLMSRIKDSFKNLSDFYKVCYEVAKKEHTSIKAIGANKVGSFPQEIFKIEEPKKIA